MLKYSEKYYEFLDTLRESGITNMFGALMKAFELDGKEASDILADWLQTFSERHPKQRR